MILSSNISAHGLRVPISAGPENKLQVLPFHSQYNTRPVVPVGIYARISPNPGVNKLKSKEE